MSYGGAGSLVITGLCPKGWDFSLWRYLPREGKNRSLCVLCASVVNALLT